MMGHIIDGMKKNIKKRKENGCRATRNTRSAERGPDDVKFSLAVIR
jgi:hypothetical protein